MFLLIKGNISPSLADLLRELFWTAALTYFQKIDICHFAETVIWRLLQNLLTYLTLVMRPGEKRLIDELKGSVCKLRLPQWHSSCPEGDEGAVQSQRKQNCVELHCLITCWSLRLTEWREYISGIWIKHCNNVRKNPNTFPN